MYCQLWTFLGLNNSLYKLGYIGNNNCSYVIGISCVLPIENIFLSLFETIVPRMKIREEGEIMFLPLSWNRRPVLSRSQLVSRGGVWEKLYRSSSQTWRDSVCLVGDETEESCQKGCVCGNGQSVMVKTRHWRVRKKKTGQGKFFTAELRSNAR